MSFFSRIFRSSPVKLSQNLGAYPLPNDGIGPLYVFFGVENTGAGEVEIVSIRVSPKGGDASLAESEIKGEVPVCVPAGGSVRFEVRARVLAAAAKDAGHTGTPRLEFAATDGEGGDHRHAFTLRVDEYLALKDE